ncbi:mitochondrial carrier domain-containing protein [Armillaria novae-zelandiae]|uniref:Mitochondrial carrier domain-containing protein n=1 Tax=Armillaria novae-zelandiae TaxID=153914 RepID=A0AA39P6Q2_9AGAR|nr:mitochondrial carrier domain-containing protein [Armillaria novae-zelandiae]
MSIHNGLDPFQAKLAAAATVTPFDVVKTRLQTQRPGSQPVFEEIVCVWENGVFRAERVNGFYDAVKHVWKAEGLRGLWKGSGTTLVIGVPSSTAYMLTYDHLLNVALPPILPNENLVPLTSGILARTTISTIASPLELIRTNLQSTPLSPDKPHTLRSVLTSIRQLVKTKGVRCLWRGLGPTLWRDVPFSGFYWGRTTHGLPFCPVPVSGTAAALITSPMDVLKTRRQALVMRAASDVPKVTSTIGLLNQIIRTEGGSALYTGLTPRIAKIAPACGIMIACFEGVGNFLAKT